LWGLPTSRSSTDSFIPSNPGSAAFYAAGVGHSLTCTTSRTPARELRSRKVSGSEKGVPDRATHHHSTHQKKEDSACFEEF
jgi:hypothetical protein